MEVSPCTDTEDRVCATFYHGFNGDSEVFRRGDQPFGDPDQCGYPNYVTFSNDGSQEIITLGCYDEAILDISLGLPSRTYTIEVTWTLADAFSGGGTICGNTFFDDNYGSSCTIPHRIIVVDGNTIHEDTYGHVVPLTETVSLTHTGPIGTFVIGVGSQGGSSPYVTSIDSVLIDAD